MASMSGSLTLRIEVQKADIGILVGAFQKEVLGKYLDFRIVEMVLS